MILYSLTEGDFYNKQIDWRPRACFIMTQLGSPVPRTITVVRQALEKHLQSRHIAPIDARAYVTGKDFLNKIWDIIISVPLGIAIITPEITPSAMANVFYELVLMQALGKETLVIKTKTSQVPSDFVRTEYIEYDRQFKVNINAFFDKVLEQGNHYRTMAEQLKQNPAVAIDYLKRAYLITGKSEYQNMATDIMISHYDLPWRTKKGLGSTEGATGLFQKL